MSHFPHVQEENYLKALYKLTARGMKKVNNIALAKELRLNPATVLEMVRKMVKSGLVQLNENKALTLTAEGTKQALLLVRKHRLWEVFLVDKLGYGWDEVHQTAEQLEHVQSPDLIDRLEAFLNYPTHDPHGDPIPDKTGRVKTIRTLPMADAILKQTYKVVSFTETADEFLAYLSKIGLQPGCMLKVVERNAYDNSLQVQVSKKSLQLSEKVAVNILLQSVGR